MITSATARGLRTALIPPDQLFSATVTLLPNAASPTVLTCAGCWWKPLDVRLQSYGGIILEGKERLINIPAEQVNPSNNATSVGGVWIREKDHITVGSTVFVVLSAGLRSVSTRWECLVSELPT